MKNKVTTSPDLRCFDCGSHGPVLTPYEGGHICEDCSELYRVGRDQTTQALKTERLANCLEVEVALLKQVDQPPTESLEYAAAAAKEMAISLSESVSGVHIGAGGEVVDQSKPELVNTMKNPTLVAIDASNHRTELITSIGGSVAAMALDIADTIQAENSVEKMVAHQLAAVHDAGMRTLQRANVTQDAALASRLLNSAARCFDTFQRGMMTLQRLRGKQEQRILVQHVNVGQGAQAVIGSIQTGVVGS